VYSETEALCKQCPEAPASGYTFALQNTSGGNLSGSLYATSTKPVTSHYEAKKGK
jgi:hypothetical protein